MPDTLLRLTYCETCCDKLFYRDAFGEVARLVHVEAAVPGDVVGEQLQRHAGHQGGHDLRRLGNRKHHPGHAFRGPVAFAGYRDHVRTPGDGLLDVGEGLLAHYSFPEDGHDGAVLVDERDGTVLHLA